MNETRVNFYCNSAKSKEFNELVFAEGRSHNYESASGQIIYLKKVALCVLNLAWHSEP